MKKDTPIYVFGALNLDVCGTPWAALRPHDSNPGRISLSAGGVGHNIALHLARAGEAVELVTLLGSDTAASILSAHCAANGIGLRHATQLDGSSSAYLCVQDAGGELSVAINDMQLLDALTPEMLSPVLSALGGASLAAVDANLPAASLALLARQSPVPLLLDPVSTFKAERVRPFIGRFTAIKPNLLEAASLAGTDDPASAADWFLREGVRQVFISQGGKGIYYADEGMRGLLPASAMRVPVTNGAGDATAAGIALGMLRGLNTKECAVLGIATATQHLLTQGGILL